MALLVKGNIQILLYVLVLLHRGSGEHLGNLCVMDTIPCTLDVCWLTILRDVSKQIILHVEIGLRNQMLVWSLFVACLNPTTGRWIV